LAWVCAKKDICCPIISAASLSQLENNAKALDIELTSDEIETLDQLYRPRDIINDYVPKPMPRHLGGVLTDS
jgi:aryl-alcohol dehydrogenase-like predicted oxidoreductase